MKSVSHQIAALCCAVDVHFPLLSTIGSVLLPLNVSGRQIKRQHKLESITSQDSCIQPWITEFTDLSPWLTSYYVKSVAFHLANICLIIVCLSPFGLLVKFIIINRSYWGGVSLGNIGTQCCSCYTTFALGMLTNSWCMGICRRLCSRAQPTSLAKKHWSNILSAFVWALPEQGAASATCKIGFNCIWSQNFWARFHSVRVFFIVVTRFEKLNNIHMSLHQQSQVWNLFV